MATDEEAIFNGYIDDLIINVTKSIQNIKKHPNFSSICDYVSALLSNSDITEEIILNRLHHLTNNNKNKPTNGRDSYNVIKEISVQVEIPPNPSNELIPGPVSYETPLIKDIGKSSSLSLIPRLKHGADKNKQSKKIKNLTNKLTALKLFVQEQF